MMMKKTNLSILKNLLIPAVALVFLSTVANAQKSGLSLKFNTGMSFSKPGGDLGKVATKGKMQLFLTTELGYHISYSAKSRYGFKIAAVAAQDNINFIAADRSTELKISVPGVRARLYPFAANGRFEDALEKALPGGKMPFMVRMPLYAVIYSALNSLHFDYGTGFGKILETDYAGTGFKDVTVNRTMTFTGWGLQPQIFQSEKGKWTANAVFDFGTYSWKNANGGTSSSKTSHVGFGVQYHF